MIFFCAADNVADLSDEMKRPRPDVDDVTRDVQLNVNACGWS